MSLIQEALRRKDDQDQGTMAIPPKQVPPIIQTPPSQPEKKSKAWLVLAISILSLLLLIVAVLGLLVYSAQHLVKTGEDYQSSSSRGAPVPPPSIPTPVAKAKPVFEQKTVKREIPSVLTSSEPPLTKKEHKPKAVPPVTRVSSASSPKERKILPPTSDSGSSEFQPRVEREQTSVSSPVRPHAKEAVTRNSIKTEPVMVPKSSGWPKLSLLGVMARETPGTGSAIINNMVIEIGEEVAGVRLLEVQRNGILLEFNGETQFVRVGQSTY